MTEQKPSETELEDLTKFLYDETDAQSFSLCRRVADAILAAGWRRDAIGGSGGGAREVGAPTWLRTLSNEVSQLAIDRSRLLRVLRLFAENDRRSSMRIGDRAMLCVPYEHMDAALALFVELHREHTTGEKP